MFIDDSAASVVIVKEMTCVCLPLAKEQNFDDQFGLEDLANEVLIVRLGLHAPVEGIGKDNSGNVQLMSVGDIIQAVADLLEKHLAGLLDAPFGRQDLNPTLGLDVVEDPDQRAASQRLIVRGRRPGNGKLESRRVGSFDVSVADVWCSSIEDVA